MRTFRHPVSTQPTVSHRRSLAPRTAFVLAGGASLGAMQVGMLRGLYERGVAPDLLVGTSAGALATHFDHASRLIAHALAAARTALAPQVVEPVAA
jgi:Patatin-like phospholipase